MQMLSNESSMFINLIGLRVQWEQLIFQVRQNLYKCIDMSDQIMGFCSQGPSRGNRSGMVYLQFCTFYCYSPFLEALSECRAEIGLSTQQPPFE